MFVAAIAGYFKFKVVSTIVVLTCSLSARDRVKFSQRLSQNGLHAAFSCDPNLFFNVHNQSVQNYNFLGVLYMKQADDSMLEQIEPEYFSNWYKWMVIGDQLPGVLHEIRYDADVVLYKLHDTSKESSANDTEVATTTETQAVYFEDVYVHPRDGASLHPWAYWTKTQGLQLTNERERILRRRNLKRYPLTIAAPLGYYSRSWYNGSFTDYMRDLTMPERDSSLRSGYGVGMLVFETLNVTEQILGTQTWSKQDHNSSMLPMVANDVAQLAGGILRILPYRIVLLDFILPVWPFSVGFTYLAERESSSNMYIEPFSPGVWWTCLGICVILAIAQRVTSRRAAEKEGAYMAVLATCLQQDASAVPEGGSGRWSFLVLSIFSMLVHAYYNSAIVSALMSTGRSGPDTLRALGDSRYAIVSEDYDYMRYLFFEGKTNWEGLEYLKKKKIGSKGMNYQDLMRGIDLIKEGKTAYHTEYNKVYPQLRTFTDDQLCKLQYVDTIPEILTWISAPKRSQWTEVFRSTSAWVLETGLVKRLVFRLDIRPPPCRSALLAERVKFGDVAPLLALTTLGAMMSFMVLGMEIVFDRVKGRKERQESAGSERSLVPNVYAEYIE